MNLSVRPFTAGNNVSNNTYIDYQHKNVVISSVSFAKISPKLAEELKPFSSYEGFLSIFKKNPKLSQHFYKNGIPPTISRATYEDFMGHSQRVSDYAVGIYNKLPRKYQKSINVDELRQAGLHHDDGKFGVPERILNKPGELSPEERAIVNQHSDFGAQVHEAGGLGRETIEGKNIISDARGHHQNLLGTGYSKDAPYPLGAQIINAADLFDAISSKRVYHEATSKEETLAKINEMFVKSKKLDLVIYQALEDSVSPDKKVLNEIDSNRKGFYVKLVDTLRSVFFKRNKATALDFAA